MRAEAGRKAQALMLTTRAAQHASAGRNRQCMPVCVTSTLLPCKIEQTDLLVMPGANAYARNSYGYVIAALYTQVPESLWADGWHYTCEGFDVFADEFAAKLVAHLRDRGMTVEGTELRLRACAFVGLLPTRA